MTSGAVHLRSVFKAYPRWPAGGRTIRAIAARRAPLALRRTEPVYALSDVSLEVGRGEMVGIIGANGAGKSTLLRLVAGLGKPTRGVIDVNGRVAAVLGLGQTLDPQLTGRENAVTAAVVAGTGRRSARSLAPRALAFAELEHVADAPVRTYSDGMRLRLAFGVIAQLEFDILLLDEVLAVGDLAFQSHCMAHVQERRASGVTVLFASHDLGQVAADCDRALWLSGGAAHASGHAAEVVAAYQEQARARALEHTPPPTGDGGDLRLRDNRVGTQKATIDRVSVAGPGVPGEGMTITIELHPHQPGIVDPIVAVAVHRESDGVTCFESATRDKGVRTGPLSGPLTVQLAVERLDLAPGDYRIDVGLYRNDWDEVYDFHWRAYRVKVPGAPVTGLLMPPAVWRVTPG